MKTNGVIFIIVIIFLVVSFIYAAVSVIDQMISPLIDRHISANHTDILTKHGFSVIEKLGNSNLDEVAIYLVYDSNTKVEYIASFWNYTLSFSPYYGSDGNVTIYKGC